MGRRSKKESPIDLILEVLELTFQHIPPWTSVPIGLIGFLVIAGIWISSVPVPQLRFFGVVFGAGFAFLSFIAGIKGVQFRRRQQAFLKADIDLKWVQSLSWQNFEKQLASVYRQNGYQVEETGGGEPDGGIDLKLFKDGRYTVVQCKHWKTWKVKVNPVRELYGVMAAERAHAAIFVASGEYTQDAREFAQGKPIELIDRAGFLALARQFQRDLQQHYGVTPSEQSQSQSPAPDSAPAPKCPRCQSSMKLKTASKGTNAGAQFWGCSRFPNCRGTRNYQGAQG